MTMVLPRRDRAASPAPRRPRMSADAGRRPPVDRRFALTRASGAASSAMSRRDSARRVTSHRALAASLARCGSMSSRSSRAILEGPLRESLLGKAIAAGTVRHRRPRPARLDHRPASQRGRRVVRRRPGDGHDAGARVRGRGVARPRSRAGAPAVARPAAGSTRRSSGSSPTEPHLTLLCGRYEGVDERVVEGLPAEEVSIGDYVLSGGELPALVVIEAVTRLLPGVIGNEESHERDSFSRARPPRPPALHAAPRVPRDGGARGPAFRRPRRDRALAPRGGAGEDARATDPTSLRRTALATGGLRHAAGTLGHRCHEHDRPHRKVLPPL